jgi:hypothetical protein
MLERRKGIVRRRARRRAILEICNKSIARKLVCEVVRVRKLEESEREALVREGKAGEEEVALYEDMQDRARDYANRGLCRFAGVEKSMYCRDEGLRAEWRGEAKAHTRVSRGMRRGLKRRGKEEVVLGLDDLSQWAEDYSAERREEIEEVQSEGEDLWEGDEGLEEREKRRAELEQRRAERNYVRGRVVYWRLMARRRSASGRTQKRALERRRRERRAEK